MTGLFPNRIDFSVTDPSVPPLPIRCFHKSVAKYFLKRWRSRRGDVGRSVVFRLARQYRGMTLNEIAWQQGTLIMLRREIVLRRYEKLGTHRRWKKGWLNC